MIQGNPNPYRNEPLPPLNATALAPGAATSGIGSPRSPGGRADGQPSVERRKPLPRAMQSTLRERMNGLALSPPTDGSGSHHPPSSSTRASSTGAGSSRTNPNAR